MVCSRKTRKRSEHYVNNKEFLYAIVQYKKDVKAIEEAGQPKPRISNYLGECFQKLPRTYLINQTLSTTCSVRT